MGSSSSEDSEISESEKEDYKEKSYNKLKAGKYKVKIANATFRCPFCEGKKKQAFQFRDLLQHAFGIGIGTKRSMKVKAKHLALEKYLRVDLSNELDNNSHAKPHELERTVEHFPNPEERFVWPWTVIVANIFRKPMHEPEDYDSNHWLKRFELYNPKEAHVLHSLEDPRGYVVLEFGTEWIGFRQMMKLDKDFLIDNHSKKDWNSRKMDPGLDLYAWCGRAEDYSSEGVVGTYLREKAELKTTSSVMDDARKERNDTVVHLAEEINHANAKIDEIETKCIQTSMSLKKIEEEGELLHEAHVKEMEMMQQLSCEHARRIMEESEKLQHDIYAKSAELDRWCQQLSEQEILTCNERRNFEEAKKRKMESLILASKEQVKAKSEFVSLLEKHQMEKKTQTDALLKLEKEMNYEHNLKLEIAELEGQLKVSKCMNVIGADREKRREKEIEEMEEKLEDMLFDMSVKEDEIRALELKEQTAKTELEEARQELIKELPKLLKGCTDFGVKNLGEINAKPFQKVCKSWYKDKKKASLESAKLHEKWQNQVLDSTWHPFKIVEVEGKEKQEVIDEDDQKLSSLKKDVGEEAYMAVVTALKELHECNDSDQSETNPNPRRKSKVPKLWNFKSGRIASTTEVLVYINSRVKKRR
ncbi:hypothetical protein VNO77_42685 [Canavalia gladiata]|uniref:Uncharacterized protein n=1 Tax=Canavalia gladiata TaxID=3824 RepID=A0AAN9JUY3_CANGL